MKTLISTRRLEQAQCTPECRAYAMGFTAQFAIREEILSQVRPHVTCQRHLKFVSKPKPTPSFWWWALTCRHPLPTDTCSYVRLKQEVW